jgi:predicted anti-sigma-YlaC factor YlaD
MSRFANDHERAFELACMAFAESIAESDRNWLEEHLAGCAECRTHFDQTRQMITALKTVSVSAGLDLVQSTRRQVRALCLQREARTRRMRPIWISSAFASVWMACTAPYLWQSFDLTGHWLHIPDLLWQMGFLVTWFTPALTGAAVALWLRPQLTQATRARLVRAAA